MLAILCQRLQSMHHHKVCSYKDGTYYTLKYALCLSMPVLGTDSMQAFLRLSEAILNLGRHSSLHYHCVAKLTLTQAVFCAPNHSACHEEKYSMVDHHLSASYRSFSTCDTQTHFQLETFATECQSTERSS